MGASFSCNYSLGGQRVWACDLSFYIYTRLLGPYSHQISTYLLRLFSPQVFTLTSSPWSSWVFTRPLWGQGTSPTRHLVPLGARWNCVLRVTLCPLTMLVIFYQDLWVSHLFDGLSWASGFWGAQEFTHYVKCIRVTSIRSMVALTASIFSQHASATMFVLLPQWLRGGYFVLALELECGLEQKSQTLVDASWPSSFQVQLRTYGWLWNNLARPSF